LLRLWGRGEETRAAGGRAPPLSHGRRQHVPSADGFHPVRKTYRRGGGEKKHATFIFDTGKMGGDRLKRAAAPKYRDSKKKENTKVKRRAMSGGEKREREEPGGGGEKNKKTRGPKSKRFLSQHQGIPKGSARRTIATRKLQDDKQCLERNLLQTRISQKGEQKTQLPKETPKKNASAIGGDRGPYGRKGRTSPDKRHHTDGGQGDVNPGNASLSASIHL